MFSSPSLYAATLTPYDESECPWYHISRRQPRGAADACTDFNSVVLLLVCVGFHVWMPTPLCVYPIAPCATPSEAIMRLRNSTTAVESYVPPVTGLAHDIDAGADVVTGFVGKWLVEPSYARNTRP